MKITLNNNPEIIDSNEITIQELITLKNYTFALLITKVNGQLVKKEDRSKFSVRDGDNVAIIHLISGG
jgi:thiazole synthase/sulfur carrier protein